MRYRLRDVARYQIGLGSSFEEKGCREKAKHTNLAFSKH